MRINEEESGFKDVKPSHGMVLKMISSVPAQFEMFDKDSWHAKYSCGTSIYFATCTTFPSLFACFHPKHMSLSEQPGVPKIGFCWFITPKTVGLVDISEIPWDIPTSTAYFLRVLGDKKRETAAAVRLVSVTSLSSHRYLGTFVAWRNCTPNLGIQLGSGQDLHGNRWGSMGIHGGFSDKLLHVLLLFRFDGVFRYPLVN